METALHATKPTGRPLIADQDPREAPIERLRHLAEEEGRTVAVLAAEEEAAKQQVTQLRQALTQAAAALTALRQRRIVYALTTGQTRGAIESQLRTLAPPEIDQFVGQLRQVEKKLCVVVEQPRWVSPRRFPHMGASSSQAELLALVRQTIQEAEALKIAPLDLAEITERITALREALPWEVQARFPAGQAA
jgi:hypothetical protein